MSFGPGMTPVVKRLLIIMFAAYLIELVLVNWSNPDVALFVVEHLMLRPEAWLPPVPEIWQAFTYMWLHDPKSPFHLLLNLLMVWMFGATFEQRWGSKDFLRFFLVCGLGGAAGVLIIGLVDPAIHSAPTLGASGAVLGLVAAYGILFSNQTIYLFFVLPIKGSYLIPASLVLILLEFLSRSQVSYAAHLGGLTTGYLLVTGLWRPSRVTARIRLAWANYKYKKRRQKLGVVWRNDDDDPGKRWLN